jgi:hypothetical protein
MYPATAWLKIAILAPCASHCWLLLLQVVIADDRQVGYFLHIWRRLSWPHPLRILRKQPFPDNTCFSKAIIAPYAAHAQSLLTYKAGSVDEVLCESVVLQATSRWLRYLFRDLLPPSQHARAHAARTLAKPGARPGSTRQQGATDAAGDDSSSSSTGASAGGVGGQQQPGLDARSLFRDLAPLEPSPTQSVNPLELLYVVWLSRLRFEQQAASGLTSWQKARVLSQKQQEELVLELQRAVLQWNAQTCLTEEQKDCQARRVMFSLQVGGARLPSKTCLCLAPWFTWTLSQACRYRLPCCSSCHWTWLLKCLAPCTPSQLAVCCGQANLLMVCHVVRQCVRQCESLAQVGY